MSSTGLLLIAHGSRQPEANADLYYLAEQLKSKTSYPIIEAGFLELAEPNIFKAGEACVKRGASRVVLLPCFLSAGVHVRRDLAEHRERLAESFPQVEFVLGEPIGRHQLLLEILAERAGEADQGMAAARA